MKADFMYRDEWSLILLYPLSRSAQEWVEENVWLENWQDSGRIAVEPRYFGDLVNGIINSNLTIEKL